MRSLLYAFTERALYEVGKRLGSLVPTRRKIGDLLEALTVPLLLSNNVEQPCWLDQRDVAGPVVATTNGLLDISTKMLLRTRRSSSTSPAFRSPTTRRPGARTVARLPRCAVAEEPDASPF